MLKSFFLLLVSVLLCSTAQASILVYEPNGSFETKPNLAIAVGSAAGKTIVITSPQVIDDITIPPTTKLKIEKSGLLTINRGKKLTINGMFEAGLYQVFAENGKVSGMKHVNPVWFADTQTGNQQAFDAVAPNGVLELTSTRTINSISVRNPMSIKGTGGLKQPLSAASSNILVLAADGISVDSITIIGEISTGNKNHKNASGINCSGRSNIIIRNCTIKGKQNGIQNIETPTAVTNITIQNNTIRYTGYGIVIWPTNHPAQTTKYGSNITISGNDVRLQAGFDASSENIRGIRVSHCDNVSIAANTVFGAQLSIEIWCDGRNRLAKNIVISTNTVDTWLCLDNCDGGMLKNNIVDYNLLPAVHAVSKRYGGASGAVAGIESVYVNNLVIQGNNVANQPGNGIYIGYAGTSSNLSAISSNIIIDNNTIHKCATSSISVAGLQLGLIKDSTISNNTITECGTAKNGMAINCGGEVSIAKNIINPVRNLVFSNNILKKNHNTKYTFRIFGFNNIIIDNLTSENNAGDGITIAESTSSNLTLKNSTISNNSGFGIKYSTVMKDVKIENCKVIGNAKGPSTLNGVKADNMLGDYTYLNNNNGL